jgi:signal transduction histidine kinase
MAFWRVVSNRQSGKVLPAYLTAKGCAMPTSEGSPADRGRVPERRQGSRRQSDHLLLQHGGELEAARRISETLFHHTEVDELVEATLRSALEEVGADAGSILLADSTAECLIFHHSIGANPVPRGTMIPWNKGVAGDVFQSGRPAILSDVKKSERHFTGIDETTGYTTHDMITLPLKQWKGDPIGVLNVLNKRNGTLNEGDLALLTIIAAFAALAIQQARLFEEAKLAEVVRLLGDIGHDLKNLLQPVVSGTWLLNEELSQIFRAMSESDSQKYKPNQDLCHEAITMIQRTSERIHDRVKEIADCVKGLSAPPQFAPCKIGVVVDDVLQTLGVLAADKDIALNARRLDILPLIQADHRRLYNAFYNLINNAIPEVPQGGSITISGRAEEGHKDVLVSVADTGRGMPPEIRDRLFTARAISTKAGGTGLGTKIVKDVIDAHKGEITVDSEVGIGTTFHIRLPMDPTERGIDKSK